MFKPPYIKTLTIKLPYLSFGFNEVSIELSVLLGILLGSLSVEFSSLLISFLSISSGLGLIGSQFLISSQLLLDVLGNGWCSLFLFSERGKKLIS